MPSKKINKDALTIVELMVANIIVVLTLAVVFYISLTIQQNIGITSEILGITEEGRFAVNRISRDIREAKSVIASHGAYTTTDTTVILKVPPIDMQGDVIAPSTYFDIIIYTLDSSNPEELLRIVDANVSSARLNTSELIAEGIETLLFSSEGTGLSSVSDKTSIEIVTVELVTKTLLLNPERQNGIITSAFLRN